MLSGCINYYNIIAPFNTFRFLEGAIFYLVTITPGNYTMTTLTSAVQTAVNAVAPVNTYAVTYSAVTKLTTFTRATGTDPYCVAPVLDHSLPTIDVKLGYEYNITAAHVADVGVNNYQIVSFNLELRVRGPNFGLTGTQESGEFITRTSSQWSIPIPVKEIYGGHLSFQNASFLNHTVVFPKKQTISHMDLFLVDPLNDYENINNNGSEIYINFRLVI